MKKIISIIVIIMAILQSIVLYLFFNDKLSSYPINLIDIVWVGSALLGILFGVLSSKINRETRNTENIRNTIKFDIFTAILSVLSIYSIMMGIFSIGLYLLMIGITSM